MHLKITSCLAKEEREWRNATIRLVTLSLTTTDILYSFYLQGSWHGDQHNPRTSPWTRKRFPTLRRRKRRPDTGDWKLKNTKECRFSYSLYGKQWKRSRCCSISSPKSDSLKGQWGRTAGKDSGHYDVTHAFVQVMPKQHLATSLGAFDRWSSTALCKCVGKKKLTAHSINSFNTVSDRCFS